jgi:colicin import membrane protein
MAERRENSVLFSLRELRGIEEERVKGEEEAERARIEAERRAREEEERRQREAAEAKVRAEQERQRQEQLERERIAHDAQVRLQESERRAQIEAAAKLEQHRIEAEARARMDAKKFPVGAVVGGMIGLIVLALAVVGYMVHNHNLELARQQKEMQEKAEADRKVAAEKADAERKQIEKQLSDLQAQLDKATNDAERAKIRAQMAATTSHHAGPTKTAAKTEDKPKVKIKTDTSDPLGGLPGL